MSSLVQHGTVQRGRQNRFAVGTAFQHHVPTARVDSVACEMRIGNALGHTRAVHQIGQHQVRRPLDHEQSASFEGRRIASIAENFYVVAIADPNDRSIVFALAVRDERPIALVTIAGPDVSVSTRSPTAQSVGRLLAIKAVSVCRASVQPVSVGAGRVCRMSMPILPSML